MIKIKKILFVVLILFGFYSRSQNLPVETFDNSNFSISISTYNHADFIFNGELKYEINDSILTISRRLIDSKLFDVLVSKQIENKSLKTLKTLQFENLKDSYFNYCVMITSGNEYDISITKDKRNKRIHLHHFYNKQIERLISEINKLVPEKYIIIYLDSNTKQDCKM